MKLLILHYYLSIVDGVMTSLIDLYQNLKQFNFDVNFRIICPELYLLDPDNPDNNEYYDTPINKTEVKYENKNLVTSVPFLRNNRNFGDIKLFFCLTEDRVFEADTIICSARLLYEIHQGKDITIKCKRLIVIDSLDLTKVQLNIFPRFCNIVKADHTIFLVNPCNRGTVDFKYYIYYQKYNSKRMNFMPWLKDVYTYRRTQRRNSKIADGQHLENMGRIIFEHLYHNKKVNYYTDGMFMRDGLYYYLRLFGIDGEVNHIPLDITSDEVIEELFMSENDLLLDILGRNSI